MKKFTWAFLLVVVLWGCSDTRPSSSYSWQEFTGREEEEKSLERSFIYRAKVPTGWTVQAPAATEPLYDSRLPLCTFCISEEPLSLRITLHNFPTDSIEERVPCQAQVNRWKQKFASLDPSSILILPQAYGGFAGQLFEGTGILKDKETTVMGWIMQIAPEHYRSLTHYRTIQEKREFKQMRADYTLLVTGDPALVKKHKPEILAFARSIELIREIPIQP